MEENRELREYLTKLSKNEDGDNKDHILEVLNSLSLCPIPLNFDDAKDLIGVNQYVEEKLHDFYFGTRKKQKRYIPAEGSSARKIFLILYQAGDK